MQQAIAIIFVLGLITLSGVFDSWGILHASVMWRDGQLDRIRAFKSGGWFFFGISCYLLSTRFLQRAGIVSPEIQTLIWFATMFLGVAAINGEFLRWARPEKTIAVGVIAGIAWLVMRTKG